MKQTMYLLMLLVVFCLAFPVYAKDFVPFPETAEKQKPKAPLAKAKTPPPAPEAIPIEAKPPADPQVKKLEVELAKCQKNVSELSREIAVSVGKVAMAAEVTKAKEVKPEADDAVATALEKQRQQKVADLEAKVKALEIKLAERQEEIKNLKTQLTNAQAIAAANNSGNGKIVGRLQKQLEQAQNSTKVMKTALSEAQVHIRVCEEDLKKSDEKAQTLVGQLQVAEQNAVTPTAQLQAKEKENTELTEQLAQSKQEIGELQEKLAKAPAEPAPELPPAPKVEKTKMAPAKKAEKKAKLASKVIHDIDQLPAGAVCDPGMDKRGNWICVIQEMEVDEIVQ